MDRQLLAEVVVAACARLVAGLTEKATPPVFLGHIPDYFFLSLVESLKSRGYTNHVIADLLGLSTSALYYRRQTMPDHVVDSRGFKAHSALVQTFDVIREARYIRRIDLELRLNRIRSPDLLRAAIADLIRRQLISCTGTGDDEAYMVVPRPVDDQRSAHLGIVWIDIYRHPNSTRAEITRRLGPPEDDEHVARVDEALDRLMDERQIVARRLQGEARYSSAEYVLRLADSHLKHGAVFDHIEAVCELIEQRLHQGADGPEWGASTYTFDLAYGPASDRVRSFLTTMRDTLSTLRKATDLEVEASPGGRVETVTLYVGKLCPEMRPQPTVDGAGHDRNDRR